MNTLQPLLLRARELTGQRTSATHLYCARALRDFGDGFVAVLLPVYLTALGLGPIEVGVVATVALLGSALTTLGIGLLGARLDQRHLLVAASGLMVATGILFALSNTYAVVLLVAFIGTINPSAGSVSVFVPLEHTLLARAAPDAERTTIFARYSLIGALAAAFGSLAAASPEFMATLGIAQAAALRAMFVLYAVLGVVGGFLYARIPPASEGETAPRAAHSALGPSRSIVYRLAALFSIDAFAGGFAVQSLLALWLFEKFGLSLEKTLDVIHGTTATNGALRLTFPAKVFKGDPEPGFAIDLAHKDLSLIVESANRARVPVPIVAVARESLSQARAGAYGGKDFSALLDFWCERAGTEKVRLG